MHRLVSRTLASAVVLGLLSAAPAHAADGQDADAGGSAVLRQLLSARPGTYIVRDRAVEPAPQSAAVPVFVQADTLSTDDGLAIRVPLSFGVQAPAAWALVLQVFHAARETGEPVASLSLSGSPGVARDERELTLGPGEYEMAIAVAVQRGERNWLGTTGRQHLSIPSPGGALGASPIVIGERVARTSASDAPRPFVFGNTVLTPSAANRFRQSDRLNVAFRIGGWKPDEAAKPDVTVEYVFRQRLKDRLVFFNKTKPQVLAPATLAKSFDGGRGTLATGMIIPLAAFPSGDFELEVRVMDKRAQATTVQRLAFTVS